MTSRLGGTGVDIGAWGRRKAWIGTAVVGYLIFCAALGLGMRPGGL